MKVKAIISLISALAVPTSAQAVSLNCTTTVEEFWVNASGDVFVKFRNMGTPKICNQNASTSTSQGTMDPATCKTILSMLMTAKVSLHNVSVYFDYTTPPSCVGIFTAYEVPSNYPFRISLSNNPITSGL